MSRKATKKTPSVQQYMPFAQIRDDCVLMKDGTLRAVLLVSSINFALKSEDEQNAIVGGYVNFLNSLDFPVQILIQSRLLDLDSYIASIKEAQDNQKNELLKLQTAEYKQFISELVELGDIMSKKFYVVVSFNPANSNTRSFWKQTADIFSPTKIIGLTQKQFSHYHKQLFSRVDKVSSGLAGMSLRSSVLDTQSLIELLYNTYNPQVSVNEKLVKTEKLAIDES